MEYLDGTEYVVDSVSRDGVHRICAIWEYDKRSVNGANFVYFGMELRPVTAKVRLIGPAYKPVAEAEAWWRGGRGRGRNGGTRRVASVLLFVGRSFRLPVCRSVGLSVSLYMPSASHPLLQSRPRSAFLGSELVLRRPRARESPAKEKIGSGGSAFCAKPFVDVFSVVDGMLSLRPPRGAPHDTSSASSSTFRAAPGGGGGGGWVLVYS